MCIVFLAHQMHPDADLLLLANRDEFYARPAQAMSQWQSAPQITAGRDLKSGGTWLGFGPDRSFALLTNYRDMRFHNFQGPSRGELITRFFEMQADPASFTAWLHQHASAYAGFNMLYGRPAALHYFTNVGDVSKQLGKGVFGLSNAFLDTPWPKVERGKAKLTALLASATFSTAKAFSILGDTWRPEDEALPDTGIGLDWERFLSSVFITGESYGSRCGTVAIWQGSQGVAIEERSYQGSPVNFSSVQFQLD